MVKVLIPLVERKELNRVDVTLLSMKKLIQERHLCKEKTLVAPLKEKLVRRRKGYSAHPKKHTKRL